MYRRRIRYGDARTRIPIEVGAVHGGSPGASDRGGNHDSLEGRVADGVTDCEPSVVKDGRTTTKVGVLEHVEFVNP